MQHVKTTTLNGTIVDMRKVLSKYLPWVLVVLGLALFVFSFGPLLYSEAWYFIKQQKHQDYIVDVGKGEPSKKGVKDSVFARFLSGSAIIETPASNEFSIIIEKIGVNAPVVPNVSISNHEAYTDALKQGVAHAINSDKPSKDPGNTYLFAHASLNFWELGKYATTFNLLRKIELNDTIRIVYKNKLYTYYVVNIETHEGWNTNPITRPVIEPVLTLQTCDPPGTTLNRLVVTAKLKDVQDL
ncbi:sortase [candidate division WWE3 bacterium]|uniref:Sortase n=1 Tax=candidate division WWE3 bacterium TaxID=2053526 RepID=A0A7X9HGX5_UNCKA|nr:sortase [candidate division WWE3 bacterium]